MLLHAHSVWPRLCCILAAAWLCSPWLPVAQAASEAEAAANEYRTVVQPFFVRHCVQCHGEKKQEGNLRIDQLQTDLANPGIAAHWTEIMDRINSGEMPPKDEPRPKPELVAEVAQWIATQLGEAEAARQAASNEKISFRRLSREEYRNTIRDLLGVNYDVADPTGLPDDPDWQGFERIGSVLTLSPTHVEKYLIAAEAILNEALALGPQPKAETTLWTAVKMRVNGDLIEKLKARGVLDQVRADLVPNNGALDIHELTTYTAGEYRVRVKLSGLRPPNGRAPRFRLYATDLSRVLFERDIEAPEEQPVTLDFQTHLTPGTHVIRIVNAVAGPNPEERASRPLGSKPFFKMKSRQPWQIKLTDDDGQPLMPTLLLDWIEWQGPMHESWPPPAHQQIFFEGPDAAKDLEYARQILARFASRAYRRPARPEEVERLLALVQKSQQLGDNFESAIKTGLLAVLCSNQFLYLSEGSVKDAARKLNDWELASRLSYFLWSTMPDERLISLANTGKLHEPETLRGEVQRMLHDPKAQAFAESFPRQWLQLRRVGMFEPDRRLYPDYDECLEKSMVAESTTFFREVLEHNLSAREFLNSDWTMLNERLAGHYGVAGVQGEAMRRVALTPQDHRGGVLTQASVLGLTSDGTRHRPVHRGKWILESIYGNPPPPPPPNAGTIMPTAAGQPKMSLRAKIEAHRDNANCMACHRKIDPLGLAFDQYDAIGHWRTEETVQDGTGVNPAVDPSGVLPDGRSFADAAELKQLLAGDLDKFAAALCNKLATYALRRGMTFDDRKSLAAVVEQSKANQYALGDLVERLVLSDLFQSR